MTFLTRIQAGVLLLGLSLPSLAAAKTCPLVQVADIPVTWVNGSPVISVQLGGQTARLLFDTGSNTSLLTDDAFMRLNLTGTTGRSGAQPLRGVYVNFVGSTEQVDDATMQDVQIGGLRMIGQVFPLMRTMDAGSASKLPIDGLLGFDALQSVDIALDLGHNRIQLFELQHCDDPQFPWTGEYAPVTMSHFDGIIPQLTVEVDGKPLPLTLDTGAGRGEFPSNALAAAGIKPDAISTTLVNARDGGGHKLAMQPSRFADLQIGGEDFSDIWVNVDQTPQKLADVPFDGILGEDYLRTHKVFISNSTSTILMGVTGQ